MYRGGGSRAQKGQAVLGQARAPGRKAEVPNKVVAWSRLTDAFQEGQSSLSEQGRDELVSQLWPQCYAAQFHIPR
jgi:hypothetical protein